MDEMFITYKEATLHFHKSGNGKYVLLGFHGFGQDRRAFERLEHNEHYTLFLFDIFFHGKSEWRNGEEPLEKSFWNELMTELFTKYKIDRFSLLGFSMGGKFVLATLEAFPHKIDSVFLLAPDGIKTSLWYSLATYPFIVRKFFKSMITRPGRFEQLARLTSKIGFIDNSMLRFVELQMNTEVKRKQVYLSWVVFRHLKFNMNRIANIINTNNIQLTIVIGQYDKIIRVRDMNRLLKKVRHYSLHTPQTGHTGILSRIDHILISSSQNDIQR
jgi:pimeloyl-ACP methyl ester carboxylesterase